MEGNLQIEALKKGDPIPYDLLELADPSREKIDTYLQTGNCYVAFLKEESIGVFVLQEIDAYSIEIKNIAVYEKFQGKGYGKQLYAID